VDEITIEKYAMLLAQNPDNEKARQGFERFLEQECDLARLNDLAERFRPCPEVSIPFCRRILELDPNNLATLVNIGFIHWMNGDDSQAEEILKEARVRDPDNISVLKLAATLARDNATKKKLFAKILMIDPKNRDAWENLLMLR